MNIYAAFTLFSMIILIYWVITEFFTILFRFTGLPVEKARFQVISLLTGCGYTTKESEMFLSSRFRRRLARMTMLFGYVFNITIVSTFINVFLSLKLDEIDHVVPLVAIPLVVVLVILLFGRVPAVHAWTDRRLERIATRMMHPVNGNTVMPVDYIGKDAIAQVTLHTIPEEYQGVPLAKQGLREDTGIMVMLVESKNGKAVPAGPNTVFQLGDRLTVFGDYGTICRTFHARERFTEDE